MKQVVLSPEQWAAFGQDVMDDPEKSALQRCCANISGLREAILAIQDNDGKVTEELRRDLAEKWEWCIDGHTFDDEKHPSLKALRSLIEQAGLRWPERHT